MNTLQITKIIQNDSITKNQYLGTFAFDKLPQIVRYPSCLIFNTHKSNQSGEHWLAIYYNKNKSCYFFDSMGFHPNHYNITEYLKSTSTFFTYNKKQIQGIFSTYCGYYCINFLLTRSRNISLKEFFKYFDHSPKDNDLAIKALIVKSK